MISYLAIGDLSVPSECDCEAFMIYNLPQHVIRHGLGLQKASHIGYSQGELNIETMRKIKKLLDPQNIFNPYKFVQAVE